jgi:predicted secreted protein
MIKKILLLSVISVTLLSSVPAFAERKEEGAQKGTSISLSVQEQQEVEQDQINVSLYIQKRDKDLSLVQSEINQAMKKALDSANLLKKTSADVVVSTGSYNVYQYQDQPVTQKDGTVIQTPLLWQGQQSLDIRGRDATSILEMMGKIQAMGFAVQQTYYSLSPEAEAKVKEKLITRAIQSLKDRASLVTKSLGHSVNDYDFKHINIDYAAPQPFVAMSRGAEMLSAKSSMDSAPVAQAGNSTVSVNISAEVIVD